MSISPSYSPELIDKIAYRLYRLLHKDHDAAQIEKMIHNLQTCSRRYSIDIKKLFSFSDHDFLHDMLGITSHMSKKTGKLENFFQPRCAIHKPNNPSTKPTVVEQPQ